MKLCAALVLAFNLAQPAFAQTKPLRFHFVSKEVTEVLDAYSKATGQKFVIDPEVRGKISILSPKEVKSEEAFALLSSALATHGFAVSEQGDTMVVASARKIQRSLIPVSTELPPLKPERMQTLVIPLKHITAETVNRELRILPSRDGELSPVTTGNKLIVTDWVSNLHRIAKTIAEVDKPAGK